MSSLTTLPNPVPASKTKQRSRFDPLIGLALPATLYLVVAFAIPIAILLVSSFQSESGFTLANYLAFLGDVYNLLVIWNTLKVALLTTLICLLVGYPAAFALAQSRGNLQSFLIAVMFLPLSVGVVVKTFAWTILLRSDGIVNQILMSLGIIAEPLQLIFTEKGLLIGIVNIFLPFMVLPIFSVIKQIDPRLNDAASTLGANPLYRFFKVTLPLTLPGVVAGIALVFSLSVAAYVIPTLLIGDRFKTLPIVIAQSYLFVRDTAAGSTASVILLCIAVAVAVLSSLFVQNHKSAH